MKGAQFADATLVPSGLFLMLIYHAQLLYRIRYHPATTVFGINQMNRRVWVRTMMSDGLKYGVLAVQTLRNNIMASTLLATASITLCSLIAVLISSFKNGSTKEISMLFGDTREVVSSVKLLCILVCFLVAFLCNVQSVRYYSHVSFLISIPVGPTAPGLSPDYVSKAVMRGGLFWALGLKSFYFSFPLFLWLFGPIPMFLCSVILCILLHFLDTSKDFDRTLCADGNEQDGVAC